MRSLTLCGVIPAMVTPATDDGSDIDEARARVLTRRLIDSGVHALFVCSSTGEFPLLDRTQRRRLIAVVSEENNRQLPLLVGVGAPATRQSIEFIRDAEAGGADCIVALPLHFYRVTETELESYFAAVADAASVPTLLYNYPAITSNQNISPALAARLAAKHNVIGLKDSSGDLGQALQYIEQCGPGFAVFTGADSLVLALLIHGGAGTICAAANVLPDCLVRLYQKFCAGEMDAALESQRKMIVANPLWSLGTLPAAIKAGCNALGSPVGPPFAPVQPISGARYEQVASMLKALTA